MAKEDVKKEDEVKVIEKALKVGLGLISLGEEKMGKVIDDLAKKGKAYASRENSALSRISWALSETGETLKETGASIKDRSSGIADVVSKTVSREFKAMMKRVDFAKADEIKKLKSEITKLKNRVAKLEKK